MWCESVMTARKIEKRPWTEKELQKIRMGCRKGLSARQIAHLINRRVASVKKKARECCSGSLARHLRVHPQPPAIHPKDSPHRNGSGGGFFAFNVNCAGMPSGGCAVW